MIDSYQRSPAGPNLIDEETDDDCRFYRAQRQQVRLDEYHHQYFAHAYPSTPPPPLIRVCSNDSNVGPVSTTKAMLVAIELRRKVLEPQNVFDCVQAGQHTVRKTAPGVRKGVCVRVREGAHLRTHACSCAQVHTRVYECEQVLTCARACNNHHFQIMSKLYARCSEACMRTCASGCSCARACV